MLTQAILAQSIEAMHPLESGEVEKRLGDAMEKIQESLAIARQKRFHNDFLTRLFNPEDLTIDAQLATLPDAQQAFLRGIGSGELKLVEAAGFNKLSATSGINLSFSFEREHGDDDLLYIAFTAGKKDNDGDYYYVDRLLTMVDGVARAIPGHFFRDASERLGIEQEVLDWNHCYDSRQILPTFGDWMSELVPTTEESVAAFRRAMRFGDVKEAIELLNTYKARHNKPMDHDAWESLMVAVTMKDPRELIARLIDEGASINKADTSMRTPLTESIRVNRVATVELLLSLGANAGDGMKAYKDLERDDLSMHSVLEKALLLPGNRPRLAGDGPGL